MPDSNALSDSVILRTAEAVAQMGVSGYGGVAFQVSGTFSGTLTFEATVHGSEWVPFSVTKPDSTTRVTTATAAGVFVGSTVGFTAVRARMSTYSTGGASVMIRADVASPGGGGGGGGAGTDVNLVSVNGSTVSLGQAAMAASFPVVIASDQTAIPITGSISATNPSVSATGSAVPASATYVGVLDGSGNLTGLAATKLDYDTGAGTVGQTVMGIALPASGGPVAGGTATNPLQVSLANTATNATAVKVDASASTQPVSGSLKWKATGASGGTVLTTELNSLANGAFTAYGTEINNATGLHTYGWLDVVLASLNPTSGASLTLFMMPTYDGTNYPDVPSTTNPAAQFIVQTIDVATGSAAKRVGTGTFRLPPFKVKFVLLNSTNVALGASSNTVTLYTSEQGF